MDADEIRKIGVIVLVIGFLLLMAGLFLSASATPTYSYSGGKLVADTSARDLFRAVALFGLFLTFCGGYEIDRANKLMPNNEKREVGHQPIEGFCRHCRHHKGSEDAYCGYCGRKLPRN